MKVLLLTVPAICNCTVYALCLSTKLVLCSGAHNRREIERRRDDTESVRWVLLLCSASVSFVDQIKALVSVPSLPLLRPAWCPNI